LVSSIANVLLNYFLIPIYGIKGAAVATLISQWISAYFINYFFIELKSQTLLMHKAFDIRRLLK
jgi:Na+-driven multidrug efflux pump